MLDSPAASYLEVQVSSAPPLKIVRLMNDGALASLRLAVMRLEKGARTEYLAALKKAQSVIGELHCSLDFERSPEIATQLDRIYEWSQRTILDATLKPSAPAIQGVITVFEKLQDGWNRIRDERGPAPTV